MARARLVLCWLLVSGSAGAQIVFTPEAPAPKPKPPAPVAPAPASPAPVVLAPASPAPVICPSGMAVGAETEGHCCWPEQVWGKVRARCVGLPECPRGLV